MYIGPSYAAVIRAYAFTPTLSEVVECLRNQTAPPSEIIIVDSSSDPTVALRFAEIGTKVIKYPKEEFNFSKAINLGVIANPCHYTLIISSHVLLRATDCIELGWRSAGQAEIIYWVAEKEPNLKSRREVFINKTNFSGGNGIYNTSSLIPTALLIERPFREDVLSAEDQEWSKYYFSKKNRDILRIEGGNVIYKNPNDNNDKIFNEIISIGHFVNWRYIGPGAIIKRIIRGLVTKINGDKDKSSFHFRLAAAMFRANFKKPSKPSRYF